MSIDVILATDENFNIIKNLYPLYLYDMSEHYGNLPNEYGIYEDEPVATLIEQYEIQNIWNEKPGILFPHIIMVDEKPAGFILVSTAAYAPKTSDYYLAEFFLLRPYRGKNIGEAAAGRVFDMYKGRWELFTNHLPENIRGQKFWRKTVGNYMKNKYEESCEYTVHGEKIVFRFINSDVKDEM